ncbi:hypothetical protein [Umezawaea sp. Da 62-37]|uniref:hypothetical protein n=1 Tax=Umezawaea sp. Da 62-37 TaxID=3075927 RepID=UPI0028F6E53C|nr:hypothetical protein [Umezawaea sp. Da 62-37]WNV83050.1 hypothetical protein RM788_33330 [Umezawaea sp. Da 62-37]
MTVDEDSRELARQLTDPTANHAALVRVVDHALWSRLHAADLTITPHRRRTAYPGLAEDGSGAGEPVAFADRVEALTWLENHLDTLTAYAHALHESGEHQRTWHLVDALWPLWLHRRHYPAWLELDVVALRSAAAAGDEYGQAAMCTRIGLTHTSLADYDAAAEALRAGLALWLGLRDPQGQADCRSALADLHRAVGDVWAADEQLTLAAVLYAQVQAHREEALTRHRRGALLLDQRKPERALVLVSGAVEDFAALAEPDPYNHARALIDLGRAHTGLGNYTAAAAVLTEAEILLRELDNHAELAQVMLARADLADARGEPGGRELRESALRSLEIAGSPLAESLRHALHPEPGPEATAGDLDERPASTTGNPS